MDEMNYIINQALKPFILHVKIKILIIIFKRIGDLEEISLKIFLGNSNVEI